MMFGFEPKMITAADVERCRNDEPPHRVAFAYSHQDQPRRSAPPYIGSFSIPFPETIRFLFEQDLALDLFKTRSGRGYWRSILDEIEYDRIIRWKERQGTRIFLRDCLDLSVALDQNRPDPKSSKYTKIGELEATAKVRPDAKALGSLVEAFCETITDLPGYKSAKHVSAVPARPEKAYDLPSEIAARVAQRLGLSDLTSNFGFARQKGAIKSLAVEEKWAAWDRSGLAYLGKLDGAPPVILIDDKYQSGVSIQFVASKLYEAGAGEVFGLCAVKTLRDTDNA